MTTKPVIVGIMDKDRYDVWEIGTKGGRPKLVYGLMGGTMTTKPVKGISITKDGKVKLVTRYFDASHAIASRKSKKIKVVRKSKP